MPYMPKAEFDTWFLVCVCACVIYFGTTNFTFNRFITYSLISSVLTYFFIAYHFNITFSHSTAAVSECASVCLFLLLFALRVWGTGFVRGIDLSFPPRSSPPPHRLCLLS